MKFNNPNLKNEIFVRIDMKDSYFSNYLFPSIFLLLKLLLFAKNEFMFMHVFLLYKVTNLTLYMYLFIEISQCMLYLHAIYLCRCASKNYTCTNFV